MIRGWDLKFLVQGISASEARICDGHSGEHDAFAVRHLIMPYTRAHSFRWRDHIGRWSGNQWSTLRLGRAGSVTALAISDGSLYVGGTFGMAGNKVVNNVTRVSVNAGETSPPNLQASRSGGSIVISWPSASGAGYILEEALGLQVAESWTRSELDVKEDSGTKSVTIVPTTQRFFRLRKL